MLVVLTTFTLLSPAVPAKDRDRNANIFLTLGRTFVIVRCNDTCVSIHNGCSNLCWFFDDIVNKTKDSIKKSTQESVDEAQKYVEDSLEEAVQEAVDIVQETTDETVNNVTQEVNETINTINSTVTGTIDNTVNSTIDAISGNRNPIAAIDVEGIFVGNNTAIAT